MRIGFDAKRAFFNRSGLGNYSRETINILAEFFPSNEHILYTPKPSKSKVFYKAGNIKVHGPLKTIHKLFSSYWRSIALTQDIVFDKIDLFHGLSNELPKDIEKIKTPSVVTIHDLIFLRYPEFYAPVDRRIYEKKFYYAAENARKIIAVSQQTKDDLHQFFKIKEDKIDVVYQGCNAMFWQSMGEGKKNEILMKYLIPEQFILYVGTIEERKNLLNIIKALHTGKINYPLVVIGRPTKYMSQIKAYIDEHKVEHVYFLYNVPNEDLPAIYQLAELFVYPSVFEGFGIPIVEALTSKTPVITSKGGCFAEAGGKSSIYVEPSNVDELAEAIRTVLNDSYLRDTMIIDGFLHAQQFRYEKIAMNLMSVYNSVL